MANFKGFKIFPISLVLIVLFSPTGLCQNLIFLANNPALVLSNSLQEVQNNNIRYSEINNSFNLSDSTSVQSNDKKTETLCSKQLDLIVKQIEDFPLTPFEYWFMQLLDSWGKIPAGLLSGHFRELGNFDQCLQYQHTFNDTNYGSFKGQYCTAKIPTKLLGGLLGGSANIENNPKSGEEVINSLPDFQLGVCFPHTCTTKELNRTWVDLLNKLNSKGIILNETYISGCRFDKEYNFNAADYIAFVVFGLVGVFMLLSSFYDLLMRKQQKNPNNLLVAFSVVTNGEKLFKISTHKSPTTIECLNGIRCLSIIWIVLGHSYITNASNNFINAPDLLNWFTTFFSVFFQFGTVSVDTFFFLSGLLIIWSAFKEMEKTNGRLNILMMYVHRYLRLTPALAAAVLFCVSVIKYIGNGPFWEYSVGQIVHTCETQWWRTLLYIQNYGLKNYSNQGMCISQSWYLAVDTQLYVLSPLVLIPLWKWGKKVFLPIIVLALLSNACVFTIFMNRDLSTLKSGTLFGPDQMLLTYFPTHARYSPWLIGILFGYILYETRNKEVKIPKPLVALGWLISLSILIAVVIGPYHRVRMGGGDTTKFESAIYESLSRISWAIALCWIVFACHKGYGGIVNSMLSWSIWEPFSRLSYSVYIVHMIIQFMITGNTKVDKYFSDFEVIYKFWGDFGFTLCISILLVLGFESPIIGIEKVLFKRDNNKDVDKKQLINNNVEPDVSQPDLDSNNNKSFDLNKV